ncbi:aminotransferase class V-fold PLP-dependent enzyme [Peptoniphilus equinus]|uniref:Aminotransferase class V-fold PLP-dependent enzyme n=1 Tax=Peptoniphilus equinus TaxID=3016343 RepID=A0ABY7QWX4_9FIRM|nr:aminotransferase class V-fold PLP-dependent enzyme [Peptoniphilus equinus]WBW50590.1 aminotransferase class V-fold PLP-dependent enzyme [Peptoniphilus equinus]
MIYLDNAATTAQKPPAVAQAMLRTLNGTYGNPGRGSHDYSFRAQQVVEGTRDALGTLVGGFARERILLNSGVTYSLNLAIKGLVQSTDHIITTVCEHNSVLRPLYETGCELSFLEMDENFRPNFSKVNSLIKSNTKGLVMTHGSNVTGAVSPFEDILDVAKAHGLWVILDGAQTLGQIPVDLQKAEDEAMIYAFTGHKSLYGPMGTGGLFLGGALRPTTLITGGSGIYSFSKTMPTELPIYYEAGTMNVPGLAGLCEGVKFCTEAIQTASDCFDNLVNGLRSLKKVTVFHPLEGPATHTVSFAVEGYASGEVAMLLEERGICGRSGFHCAPLIHRALKTNDDGLMRLATSCFTTADDIVATLEAVADII